MNFFERQQAARSASRRLIILFVLAVIAIVVAVNAAVLVGLGIAAPDETLQVQGFAAFAQQHPLHAIGTRGLPWIEIDFPDDYRRAVREVLPLIENPRADDGGPSFVPAATSNLVR